ncbi:MAG: peptide ABC transporter substrate-binding protein [Clostridiales bacterium]|nr:peptide ABC transporter substrate-binding protein [Clostridiales bacterium]
MKRMLCLLLTILLLPAFAFAENVQDSLVIGLVSYRTYELRPLIPQERDILSLYGLIYESLVTIDDNGIPQPLLAETWSETGGGNTWTFTLRENITFSDGTPLTAKDVAASGNYILNLANADVADKGFYQNIRYMVSSFDAPDEKTVVVKAKRDYYGVLYSMTFPVVHASQVEVASPLGTGPYVVSSFSPGSYLWLAANENWWQMEPQVKEIMANLYPSNKELITAYEYGQVDTAITRSVAAAQYKSGINSLSIAYSTRQLEVLLLNNSAPEFEDVRVRQAIRYAINKNLISQNVFMGMTINANTPVPPDNWLYYDQENSFTYNPEKAIKLLEEAGWTDTDGDNVMDRVMDGKKRNLRLRLYVYEDPENDVRFETANMIVDMLAEVKIKAVVTPMTYSEEQAALEAGSFDMALCAFQMDVVPDYGFFLRKGNNQNYCRYVSSEMTSLIDTLRTQEDQTDFAYTSQTIQQLFANDTPFICLFYRSGAILTRKMFTTVRSIREFELLRGIEAFGR